MMETLLPQDVVNKYEEVFEIYKDTQYKDELVRIENFLFDKRYDLADESLRKFSTENELMQLLEEKLKHKPINNVLKKIRKGTIETKAQMLKGLFSLGTHCMIECERGNMEYMWLAKRINLKLQEQLRTGI